MSSVRIPFPFVLLSVVALFTGVWAGLLRIGWPWPAGQPGLPGAHGPLMVSGFLGTLISLERAVALVSLRAHGAQPAPECKDDWLPYLAPLFGGLGAVALIGGAPHPLPALLFSLSGAVMTWLYVLILRRHMALHNLIMAAGAVCWVAGNGLWLAGQALHLAVPWWAGFLVLTIVGERLELSRMTRVPRAGGVAFIICVTGFAAGLILSLVGYDAGVRLAGAAMLLLAAWLLRFDIARRTIRQRGLTRFIATAMLSGYFWLAASGLLWLTAGGITAGPVYDGILHSLFLGFVFAMIFGHAPIILPAVLGISMQFSRAFYVHLGLLHLSLLLRLAGDLAGDFALRRWGGLLNALVLLLFLLNTVAAVVRGRQSMRVPHSTTA
jgi:hypothetical protein